MTLMLFRILIAVVGSSAFLAGPNSDSQVVLDPKAAKIGKGRTIPLEGPLRQIIERRIRARRFDCSLIFHRTSKGQPGQPVKDFVRQWRAALKIANLPSGLLPYDLRRSALRNMIRGGTDFTVALRISGHRTRSTFDRYNIVSEEDLRAAVTRTATYVSQLPSERSIVEVPGRSGDEHGQFTDNGTSAASPARPRLSPGQGVTSEVLAEAGGNRTRSLPSLQNSGGGKPRVYGSFTRRPPPHLPRFALTFAHRTRTAVHLDSHGYNDRQSCGDAPSVSSHRAR